MSFCFNLTIGHPDALSMFFLLFYTQKLWKKAMSQFEFTTEMSSQDSRESEQGQLWAEVMILLKEALLIISILMQTPCNDAKHRPGWKRPHSLATAQCRKELETRRGPLKGLVPSSVTQMMRCVGRTNQIKCEVALKFSCKFCI